MDAKHGRLYTADDVAEIASLARQYEREGQSLRRPTSAIVADLDAAGVLTFSADEPLFVLRGTDPVTGPTIAAYTLGLLNMDELSEDDPRVAAAAATREAIEAWQSENPDRVKVPD